MLAHLVTLYLAVTGVVQILGIVAAVFAATNSRTPQGAIAWSVGLLAFPLLALPLWLVLGRSKFNGVVNARRAQDVRLRRIADGLHPDIRRCIVEPQAIDLNAGVLSRLAKLPFLRGNRVDLLVDGEQTFAALFAAIDRAQHTVVAEFFIVNDDRVGRRFQAALIAAAQRGCDVYLLYDEVGSRRITADYIAGLRAHGVQVSGMNTTRGFWNRLQINFRNHRKIVVVDGRIGLVGGLNVGDEYCGHSPRLTPWRDTHLCIEGPAVLPLQLAFVEDWLWANGTIPELPWEAEIQADDKTLFVLPSGPDDDYETCGLFFTHLINSATERLWIASPYFVPDSSVVRALQLAAMRGVDVRILIPGLADKWLVKRAAMSYMEEIVGAGVQVYEYGDGFMHQKAAVVDRSMALVGTANCDNRSFRLNFEVSAVVVDEAFNRELTSMFEADLSRSSPVVLADLAAKGLVFRVSSRIARLFSPVL